MKPIALTGTVLVLLGIAALALGHFSFTTQKEVAVVGPLTATVSEQHDVTFPDIAGYAAIAAGLVLVGLSFRRT